MGKKDMVLHDVGATWARRGRDVGATVSSTEDPAATWTHQPSLHEAETTTLSMAKATLLLKLNFVLQWQGARAG